MPIAAGANQTLNVMARGHDIEEFLCSIPSLLDLDLGFVPGCWRYRTLTG